MEYDDLSKRISGRELNSYIKVYDDLLDNEIILNEAMSELKQWLEDKRYSTVSIYIMPMKPQILNEEDFVVEISFLTTNTRAIELSEIKLPITNKLLTTWKYNKIKVYQPTAIYAIKGFYEAFNALKALKPNLTKYPQWDEDLTEERKYDGPIGCLQKEYDREVENGFSGMTLTLLMCDIETNLNFIKSLLIKEYEYPY
jgi:hypothetical protein